jgi:hypothetical protein
MPFVASNKKTNSHLSINNNNCTKILSSFFVLEEEKKNH